MLSQDIGSEYNDYIRQGVDETITPRFEVLKLLTRTKLPSCIRGTGIIEKWICRWSTCKMENTS